MFITFVSSFTLLGVACIASEIENPFGLDANDLNIGILVDQITEEVSEMQYPSSPELFIQSHVQ